MASAINPVTQQEVRQFWFGLHYACKGNPKKVLSYLTSFDVSYYQAQSLKERIQQGNHTLSDKVKGAWERFYQATQRASRHTPRAYDALGEAIGAPSPEEYEDFLKDPHGLCFTLTDLEIIPETNQSPLAPHQMKESYFEYLRSLYDHFMKHRVEFKGGANPKLKAQVAFALQVLMSRKHGAELIQDILIRYPKNKKIIFDLEVDKFTHYKDPSGNHVIGFTSRDLTAYHEMTEGGLISLNMFWHIALGHELIHLLHSLDKKRRHDKDPFLNKTLYTRVEERFAITGYCPCHHSDPNDPYPYSENSLRKAFNLFPRSYHTAGINKRTSPATAFFRSITRFAIEDLKRMASTLQPSDVQDAFLDLQDMDNASHAACAMAFAKQAREKGILPFLDTPRAKRTADVSFSSGLANSLFPEENHPQDEPMPQALEQAIPLPIVVEEGIQKEPKRQKREE